MNRLLLLLVALFSANAVAKPVNINRADAINISESLTGISLKKAENIVIYRLEHGDFKSVDDLNSILGIGAKTIEVNKKDILLADAPKKLNRTGRHHSRSRERHGHTHQRKTKSN
jgi:competence protein ComEA